MYTNCISTDNTVKRGENLISIDYKDSKSIYEQIVDGFKSLIINKALKEHERLPSVRELSVELTINPNTVQRAYRELEALGFIYSMKGKGSFVSPVSYAKDDEKILKLYRELKESVKALYYLGESRDTIINNIKEELK